MSRLERKISDAKKRFREDGSVEAEYELRYLELSGHVLQADCLSPQVTLMLLEKQPRMIIEAITRIEDGKRKMLSKEVIEAIIEVSPELFLPEEFLWKSSFSERELEEMSVPRKDWWMYFAQSKVPFTTGEYLNLQDIPDDVRTMMRDISYTQLTDARLSDFAHVNLIDMGRLCPSLRSISEPIDSDILADIADEISDHIAAAIKKIRVVYDTFEDFSMNSLNINRFARNGLELVDVKDTRFLITRKNALAACTKISGLKACTLTFFDEDEDDLKEDSLNWENDFEENYASLSNIDSYRIECDFRQLKSLPKGAHHWNRLLTMSNLNQVLLPLECDIEEFWDMTGHPISDCFDKLIVGNQSVEELLYKRKGYFFNERINEGADEIDKQIANENMRNALDPGPWDDEDFAGGEMVCAGGPPDPDLWDEYCDED